MAAKTFIPTFVRIVHAVCYYSAKYDAQIRQNLPSGAIPYYNALRSACAAFNEAVGALPKNP